MKRLLSAIVIMSAALLTLGQAIQPCIVKQYNQKMPKTPLSGVEVMVSNAGSQVSASDGKLVLNFRTLKPGDKVNLISALKSGFEVMNAEAVEQWFISRDQTAFEMVMVNSEEFVRLKKNLKEASTESYRTKYQQAMLELEQQKKAGRLKEEEFNRKCDTLESSYKNQLKNLDNYIDQFARIDLSEASAEEQRILDMAQEGKINEAVKAYEQLDISGKLRQARENQKTLSEAKAKIEEEESNQAQAIQELKVMQQREIATLKLAGGKDNYDKVARMLKENALADSTDIDAIREYAVYAHNQKDYRDAEVFYQKLLGSYTQLFSQKPEAFREDLAWTQNNLGILYSNLNNYNKSEEYYLNALENRTLLFNLNPDAYRDDIALEQNNLGILYTNINDYKKAEDYFLKALDNYTLLFNLYPDAYQAYLAGTQNNLGNLYGDLNDLEKTKKYFLLSLDNYLQLFNHDPDAYRADLAMVQHNLGNLYYFLNNLAKGEYYYLKALDNRILLFNMNPDAYRTDLASTQNNLGSLYRVLQDYDKAELYLLQALENKNHLFNLNPSAYRADLANTQTNLGNFYYNLNNYSKAEEYFLKALENNNQLFNEDPDVHRANLARTQNNLGALYDDLSDYTKAEYYYLKALENYTELFNKNHNAYRSALAGTQNNLGYLYRVLNNISKSEEYYLKSIDNYTQLYNLYPESYLLYLYSSLNSLAYLYANNKDFGKAIETINQAIALSPENPNSYDSKGEILLMNDDEQGALEMWQKVMELDSDFLSKHNGGSELYKQLKERKLLK